jgi:septal ring factor EnvC (AmiA/AmiB activator)
MEQIEKTDNFKNYLILFLGGVSVILLLFFIFGGGEKYNDELERLRADNARLAQERDRIQLRVDSLHKAYEILDQRDDSLATRISAQDKELAKLYSDSKRSKTELDKIRKEIAEAMKKIESLKKNPPNRTGTDLINSLKLKTTK